MRQRIANILLGILLVGIGINILGSTFNLFDVSLRFQGDWILLIIVLCLLYILAHGIGIISTILLCCAVLMFLDVRQIMVGEIYRKMLIPFILVVLGVYTVIKNFTFRYGRAKVVYGQDACYAATFSSRTISNMEQPFCGAQLDAIFGGITLDLRNSSIPESVFIDCTSVFGGIDIYVPKGIRVKVNSTSCFGGVKNYKNRVKDTNSVTVYIDATCMFGGVEIK